jgi:subtilase family protein
MKHLPLLISLTLAFGLSHSALAAQQSSFPDGAKVVNFADTVTVSWVDGDRSMAAVSMDGGQSFGRPRQNPGALKLRFQNFDPIRQELPALPHGLAAGVENQLWIVQYIAPGVEAWRDSIEDLGGSNLRFLANRANIWRMSASAAAEVATLPFVRWVGPMQPAYKLEDEILHDYQAGALTTDRYNVVVGLWGVIEKAVVADHILSLGGTVNASIEQGWILEATLTPEQLLQIAGLPEVLGIDRWSLPETDMNVVRNVMGANYIETMGGYTGTGVRAEVMDGNLDTNNSAWKFPPVIHGSISGSNSHGTSTYSINFSNAGGNTRGMAPDAQGIFADYGTLGNRYTHTAELVSSPYYGVYQSNSWGGSRTFNYNSTSQQMDDIIRIYDIVITQSQSNAGNQDSRPQAWAKNIVAVGGIRHYNDTNSSNDNWASGASTGPAADGRVKPDLSAYYDSVATVNNSSFGGTSAASPIVAGHFALFFEMWHDGIWGNTPGATVFDSRPHSTLARALMINSATQWPDGQTDITRMRQGWGRPDMRTMYDRASQTFWINETDVLQQGQSTGYAMEVAAGEPDLRVTMIYADAPGTTTSNQHRINDLSLRVTSPSGVRYWGNNGLTSGAYNWSTSGGTSNKLDPVENVFVQTPEAGIWTVEVYADEVNQDTHEETGALDADYALVVSQAVENNSGGVPNRIELSGPGTAQTGSPVGLTYGFAPANAPFVILYSLGQTGSILQGHAFDLGPNPKTGFSGTTNALGAESFLTGNIPNAAAGLTLYLEMGASSNGVIWDSNVTQLIVL